MTSSTPLNPRSASERRNAFQKGSASEGPTASPNLTASLRVGAGGNYYSDIDDPAALPNPHIRGVDPHIAPLPFDRTVEERIDAFVDLADEAGYLALGDASHAHGPDEIIDRSGGDALDIGLLDD